MTTVSTVSTDVLRTWSTRLLEALDLPAEDALVVADSLVAADLRGVHSHGVMRLPTYARGLRDGTIKARPNVHDARQDGGQAVLDGDAAMGQVAAQAATTLAIALCEAHGVGTVAVRNSNHCGAMAYYAVQGLSRSMIGLTITNAGLNMFPTGGMEKLVGNNPIAIAVPTNRPWPLVLDMATSVAAGGKLDVAASKGVTIPLGWAVDGLGKPTTDPVAGRQGALLPIGGPKGYGLAVMLDVLAGVLSDGRFGGGLGGPGSSHFFMMIAVERFQSIERFKAHMDELIDQLQQSRLAVGSDRIYLPGEIEYELEHSRRREGIALEPKVLADLASLADSLNVSPLSA